MNKKQWVCHISGQGEKWEVDSSRTYADDTDYCVRAKLQNTRSKLHWLPKSEYCLCDPPEAWEDVSEGARVGSDLSCILYDNLGREISVHNGYRLRKVQAYQVGERAHVFIVEQRVKP